MGLKVRANERLQKIGNYAGTYRYVLAPRNTTTVCLLSYCDRNLTGISFLSHLSILVATNWRGIHCKVWNVRVFALPLQRELEISINFKKIVYGINILVVSYKIIVFKGG